MGPITSHVVVLTLSAAVLAVLVLLATAHRVRGLRAERDLLAGALQQLGDRVVVCGPDGRPVPALVATGGAPPAPGSPLALALEGRRIIDEEVSVLAGEDAPDRWFSLTGGPITDARGRVVGAVSAAHEVTARRRAERGLRDHLETLRAISAAAQAADDAADPRTAICNAAVHVSGAQVAALYEPDADGLLVLTAHAGDAPPPASIPATGPSPCATSHRTGRPLFVADAPAAGLTRAALEQPAITSALVQPVRRRGEAIGVLTVGWCFAVPVLPERVGRSMELLGGEVASVVERARLLALLRTESRTDALTALPNRRTWDEELPRELARARRHGTPACVALADLDRFKAYNDEHGHQAGDRLLRAIAAAWPGLLRETDLVARWGGEEFAVLLPDCGAEDARLVLERLRAHVPDGQTCSFGLAEWDGVETAAELLGRADALLYDAKAQGRDRVLTA